MVASFRISDPIPLQFSLQQNDIFQKQKLSWRVTRQEDKARGTLWLMDLEEMMNIY